MKFLNRRMISRFVMMVALMGITSGAFADGPPAPSVLDNPLALTLLIISVVLLLAIGLLAYILLGVADIHQTRNNNTARQISKTVMLPVILCFTSMSASAQDVITQNSATKNIAGMSVLAYYTLLLVIGLEISILLGMLLLIKKLIKKEKPEVEASLEILSVPAERRESVLSVWWTKLNNFRPAAEEGTLLLDHNYDGIHELDNKLPPWWLYGFFACILFAFVYLYRFHVSHSEPLASEEYAMAMAQAEVEKQAYLKTAANNVDENSVALLTDAAALSEGQKLFISSCAPCHGAEGQGVVGPNLTDDYWLHNGGIRDIFKTIKYGYPEKGMKSWKEDFSPLQISALASYIKSLHGTKPPNPKEPQGDLFKGEKLAVSMDTTTHTVLNQ